MNVAATITATVTAAVRATAKGAKLYIHSSCTCAKVNGRKVPSVGTFQEALGYAETEGIEWTLCKTSAPVETVQEEAAEGDGAPEFEVTVDNTDQYGKQRRDAIAAMVEALGAEMEFRGVKNRHRTGNDAFLVTVTKAPATLQPLVESFLTTLDEELEGIVADAKSHGAAEGWDSNTRQKHYKNTARRFITAKGAEMAAKLG